MSLEERRIAVIGAGNMGRALIRGLVESGRVARENLVATGRDTARLEALGEDLGVRTSLENAEAVAGADLLLLAVKPQSVPAVAADIAPSLGADTPLISIVAGLTTARLEALFGGPRPIVRTMPNIPAMVECAATAICGGAHALEEHFAAAETIFNAVGEVVRVTEKQMDAVTGLSGSGPAYIYMVIEALTDGGVKMGLPRDVALRLATQTVLGSARLVQETQLHPAILRDQVTTPGGTTIAAIHDLETHGLRPMLISAVVTATERSRALNEDEAS
jgi:pyrroline-5-carboxylate reductase